MADLGALADTDVDTDTDREIVVAAATYVDAGLVAPVAVDSGQSAATAPIVIAQDFTRGTPSEATLTPSNPAYQWHLSGTWGVRANLVWNITTGDNVRVAVFDDGFEYTNSDLAPNYLTNLDYDTYGNDYDAARGFSSDNHGTAVAGTIAADDNGSNGVGVAFDADLIGIRRAFGSAGTYDDTLEGFNYARTAGARVMNNSWGSTMAFVDHPTRNYSGTDTTEIMAAIKTNSDAGMIQVFAAGNSRTEGDNVNYHGFQNSPYVITVGGTDVNGRLYDSSTPGDAILISAPAEQVVTIDVAGTAGYVNGNLVQINGTSFAAPIVSGVLALMLEVNPYLSTQVASEILALTARRNDSTNSSWQETGTGAVNGGAMYFSHDYGFGLVDARAAVAMSEWMLDHAQGAGSSRHYDNFSYTSTRLGATPNMVTADRSANYNGIINSAITVGSAYENIDVMKVRVDVTLPHTRSSDLQIILISPSGTQSVLVDHIDFGTGTNTDAHGYTGINFTFTSNAFMYESAVGNWTLRVIDTVTGSTGTLSSWGLTFVGDAIFSQKETDTVRDYFFTDDYASASGARQTLSVGGTLNTVAVTTGVTLHAMGGTSDTVIAGKAVTIASAARFTDVDTGWGNDIVTNGVSGQVYGQDIHTSRGDDTIRIDYAYGSVDGGIGNDRVVFLDQAVADFEGIQYDSALAQFIFHDDAVFGAGVTGYEYLTSTNIETYQFTDQTLTAAQLQGIASAGTFVPAPPSTPPPPPTPPSPPADTTDIDYRLGQTAKTQRSVDSNDSGTFTKTGPSAMAYNIGGNSSWTETRTETTLDISLNTPATNIWQWFEVISPVLDTVTVTNLRYNTINLTGSDNGVDITLNRTMGGTIWGGAGDDTLTITLVQLTATSNLQSYTILMGEGSDDVTVYGNLTASRIAADLGNGDNTFTVDPAVYRGQALITGGANVDTITTGLGYDTVTAGAGDDIIDAGGGIDTVYGGDGADTINGGLGNDYLYGDAGGDIIRGGDNNDRIWGGSGTDQLYGDAGDDTMYGDAGIDVLYGGTGVDIMYGGADGDTLYGGDGNDRLFGDDGNDTLMGEAGNDQLDGGNGDDYLDGAAGADIMRGRAGSDTLLGGADGDTMYGDEDDDYLWGQAGVDVLYGGTGADTFVTSEAGATYDRIGDYSIAQGDVLQITNLLVGFDASDDIDNFVRLVYRHSQRTDIQINADGAGNDWAYTAILYGNLTGQTAQTMYDNHLITVA
jgi:subtilisin-like proprotein convertase family protein